MALDRNAHAFDDREAVIRVVDREREDIGERPRTEFLQQQEPAAESTGNAGGKHTGARNQVVAQVAEALDRRRSGSDSLAAERQWLASLDRVEERRDFSTRPVQVRLDDLQREAGRNDRVERISAALQNRHAGSRSEPVRRRDHAERSA